MQLCTAAFGWQSVNLGDVKDAGNLFERLCQSRKPFRANGGDIGIDVMGGDFKRTDVEPLIGQDIDYVARNAKPVFTTNFKPHICTEKFTL